MGTVAMLYCEAPHKSGWERSSRGSQPKLPSLLSTSSAKSALMEKEMDENVAHDLVLACHHLAQQLSEDDLRLDTTSRRKSKAKQEALRALLSLGDQRDSSFNDIIDLFWTVYASSPAQSNARQQVAQMLLGWAQRRDIPLGMP